jgi:tetratricopeptide (TPR) repeat protein
MSKLEKFTSQPEYKNADREALKYAVRYRKKDRDLEHLSAHEDFFRELNTHAMDAGMHWFEMEQYAKARMIFSRMVGYDPENPGAWQMLALCQTKSRNERDAAASMQRYQEVLATVQEEDPRLGRLDEAQMKLMKEALILHSEHLTSNGMADSARVVLDLGIDHFADDPQFKMMYQELN